MLRAGKELAEGCTATEVGLGLGAHAPSTKPITFISASQGPARLGPDKCLHSGGGHTLREYIRALLSKSDVNATVGTDKGLMGSLQNPVPPSIPAQPSLIPQHRLPWELATQPQLLPHHTAPPQCPSYLSWGAVGGGQDSLPPL